MQTRIVMPRLGESVTEGTVDRWLKREGEQVRKDEPLVEVVTDKVSAEVPCPVEGTLLKILVGEGQTVPCLTEIALMEDAAAAADAAPSAPRRVRRARLRARPTSRRMGRRRPGACRPWCGGSRSSTASI